MIALDNHNNLVEFNLHVQDRGTLIMIRDSLLLQYTEQSQKTETLSSIDKKSLLDISIFETKEVIRMITKLLQDKNVLPILYPELPSSVIQQMDGFVDLNNLGYLYEFGYDREIMEQILQSITIQNIRKTPLYDDIEYYADWCLEKVDEDADYMRFYQLYQDACSNNKVFNLTFKK